MVIIFFTMTAAVATSIVRCVMVVFASVKTGLLSVVTPVVGCFFLIFVLIMSRFIFVELRYVVGCGEGGGLSVDRFFDFHLIVNYVQGVGSWTVGTSSGFILVELVL